MEKGNLTKKVLWSGGEKYARHRIPGMLVTDKGTLLVYNEARMDASDWALMDIMMQRSTDFGESFSEPVLLAQGTEKASTVNNPVMMQDKNGRIHLLYCENYGVLGGRILQRFSDDDGLTWSEVKDITEFTMPEYRNAFAFGPGHGICTKDGTIIVPVWMVPKFYDSPIHSHNPSKISTFFSKDNGKTFEIGDIIGTKDDFISPNETVATELENGDVYLSVRLASITCRGKAISRDGHSNWFDVEPVKDLIDPGCFGSVASYNDGKNPYTLVFANCESKTSRTNVTVKGSIDGGKTWAYRKVLDVERGGYVEVQCDSKNGFIYVLYEDKFGTDDILCRFDYAFLSEN